jgi:hypothetical protein
MEMSRFVSLAVAHAGLARAIAPATPEAVLLMADERERHPRWSALGPVPIVRQMLGLALLSLVVLLAGSINAVVNSENMAKSLLELSGFPLLMVEGFLVSAASLGACFANLQTINTFISEGTYDPRFQSTYWTRWVMGYFGGHTVAARVQFPSGASGGRARRQCCGRDRATDPRADWRLFRRFRPRRSEARDQYGGQFLWCLDRPSGRQSATPRESGGCGAGETGQDLRSWLRSSVLCQKIWTRRRCASALMV